MKEIIEKYKIKAKKSLWQNFLMDENILEIISSCVDINWENIVEVWPWFWALTSRLLQKQPNSLTLVELDNFMIEILQDRLRNSDFDIGETKFEILNQDVLKFSPLFENYKIIANIPYYITSPILFRFLYEVWNIPTNMVILMQKEVWEKILSQKSSVLSLFIKRKCDVKKEVLVPKNAFSPAPKVDSIVLSFVKKQEITSLDEQKFLSFIKASFSNPRKKMINNLSALWYDKNKVLNLLLELWFNENSRAEDLSISDYEFILKNI